jgi:basic membrane protein A
VNPRLKPGRLIALLVAANVVLVLAGAMLAPAPAARSGTHLRVGLVFDIGGKNDRSFNEAAWRGLEQAKRDLDIDGVYVEPSAGADRETALRQLAADHYDLVIAVGFIFGPTLERLAKQFPDVKFAGIDYSPSDGVGDLPNLAALRFREQEGAFLVGAIAGLTTHTKVVGFVGGMQIPLIRKFEAGYTAGVHHVCPECRVLAAYAGTDPKAFADPLRGRELAAAQYGQDADIIFHASGKTGDGVFAEARERGALAIGVDSDQYPQAPCCMLTSMIKRVDVAVVDIIKDVLAKRFRGGLHELGIAEQGVTFVSDEHNRNMLPLPTVAKVHALADQIVKHEIQVPDR